MIARKRLLITVPILAVIIPSYGMLHGQELPGAADPSQLPRRLEQPRILRVPARPVVPETKVRRAVPPAAKVRFVLTDIQIEGATAFEPVELRSLFEGKLKTEVSLAEIYEIAGRITARYREAGYILSQAIIPRQRITGGVVKIRVVEGFIDRVIVGGDVPGNRSTIEAFGEKIKRAKPTRLDRLERYLLLIEDLPGVSVQSVLRPSSDVPYASDLVLTLSHDKYDAVVRVDNRGSRFLGPFQLQAQPGANSAFGAFERIEARYIRTIDFEELEYVDARYTQPFGTEGATVEFFTSYSWSELGFDLADDDIDGRVEVYSVALDYPLIRGRERNLSLRLSFLELNQFLREAGAESVNDRIRKFTLTTTYDFVDRRGGRNFLAMSLNQGVEILGASEGGATSLSRANGRPDFTTITASMSRRQTLDTLVDGLSATVSLEGQYAISQVLSPEEFSFGGEAFGRAFDASEITGDHGAATAVEFQYSPLAGSPKFVSYQLYAFADHGHVFRVGPEDGSFDSANGTSAGFGIRLSAGNLFADLQLAKPLTHAVETQSSKDWRVFFSLTGTF